MENPKLALIPSGYKSGKVYSILPVNGVGDFTFSRAGDGTRVRKDGLIETVSNNVPRLDWLNSNCPSLLLEPQTTNDFTYSEEFTQSVWADLNSTITTNQTASPDGSLTADLLTSTASSGGVFRYGGWNTTQKTISIFVKKNTSTTAEIYDASSITNRVVFNLDNGTVATQGGSMTGQIEGFENGWFRISVTYTATGSNTFGLIPETNETLFIWGAQSESAANSTSYIKTTGSSVTREKDICLNGGDADLFNVSELSLFIDVTNFNPDGLSYIVLTDGQSSPINMIRLDYTQNSILIRSYDSGTLKLSYNINSVVSNQRNKLLLTFDNNEAKTYFNGILKNTSTSITIPSGLDSLSFSNRTETGGFFQGKVHDTRVYDRVLTEAEAIKLTA